MKQGVTMPQEQVTGDVIVCGDRDMTIGVELYQTGGTGRLAFYCGADTLAYSDVTFAHVSGITSALLQVLLIANDYPELATDEKVRSISVPLTGDVAFTITVLFRKAVDYGEIMDAEDGSRFCEVQEWAEPYALELLLGDGERRFITQVEVDEANGWHTNLAGLLFRHARLVG
ncbi:hypothetical protein [Catellatospora methionotrophica]|uniref:hypothetical protein n=1 Tax=Catellatospora methionotrophica TaxID=121620 RepID=UPI0033DF995D